MEMADEKKQVEKQLQEFVETVRKGAENRAFCFAIVAWFPDQLNSVTTYWTDWNGENFAARGATQELLREMRLSDSHNGNEGK